MFEKLKKTFENAIKQAAASVDTEIFNHPIAQQTDWHPLRGGGANFQTHRLDSSNPDKLVFKATIGAKLFSGLFAFIGFFGLTIPLYIFVTGGMKDWSLLFFALFFGGIFLGIGLLMLYLFAQPRVFDTFYGYYFKGWKRPNDSLSRDKNKTTNLNQVEAIQVLRERVRSKNSSYYSYEINLVLDDASRINITDHGKHQAIIQDAETLAQALGVPLWDGS